MGTLNAGTPLWQKPPEWSVTHGRLINTLPAHPLGLTADHTVFAGVTVRDGEDETHPLKVATDGPCLVRVKGPVAVGESVGRANPADSGAKDYLAATAVAGGPACGTARQAVATGSTKLIQVMLGGGGSSDGSSVPVWG